MVTEVGKVYQINLNVLNQENQVSAGVMVEVKAADMTPERILNSLDSFRTHPIPKSIRIGMSEGDVYCIEGLPDQTNTNAIGDDQMVYRDSDLYVYIGKNGRVVNFQESR